MPFCTLKNTGDDNAKGELCRWDTATKTETSVDTEIVADNFKLANDGKSVTYIKNFNPIVHTGDLLYSSFAEGGESQRRIDEKVAFVFGTSAKSSVYFYAKNYDHRRPEHMTFIFKATQRDPNPLPKRRFWLR